MALAALEGHLRFTMQSYFTNLVLIKPKHKFLKGALLEL
jgi:hypothetical protein